LGTLAIRFWKERTPFPWRSTIHTTFRRTAVLTAKLSKEAIQTRDEGFVGASG